MHRKNVSATVGVLWLLASTEEQHYTCSDEVEFKTGVLSLNLNQARTLDQTATKAAAFPHQQTLVHSQNFDTDVVNNTMHFAKTLLALVIPFLAFCDNPKLEPRTISPPFHLLAIHSTSPVHLQPINARLGGFYMGESPDTYCPRAPCPLVDQTGLIVANGKAFLVRASGIQPRKTDE